MSRAERARLASSGRKLNLPNQRSKSRPLRAASKIAAAHHALGETGVERLVAQRVAQAQHEDEAGAADQERSGQQVRVAARAAQAQPDVRGEEGGEKQADPKTESGAELRRAAHDEERLEDAKLVGGDGAANGAHVGQAAGKIIDLARGFVAILLAGNKAERRQQVLARAEIVKVEQLVRGDLLIGFRQSRRFHLIHAVESESHQQAGGGQEGELARAPAPPARLPFANGGSLCRAAAGYRHMWRSFSRMLRGVTGSAGGCSMAFKRKFTLSRLSCTLWMEAAESPYGTMLR